MAGIFGGIGIHDSVEALPRIAALGRSQQADGFSTYLIDNNLLLGAYYRAFAASGNAYCSTVHFGVVVYGYPIDSGRGCRVSASEVLATYQRDGIDALGRLDGGFQITVVDHVRRRLFIVNDRMATCPLHVWRGPGRFAFGPDAKTVLVLSGATPALDAVAALEFLSMGYAVGTRTLFTGIELLEPAQVLEVSLDDGTTRQRTYWELRFQPRQRLTEAEAAGDLHTALQASIRAAMTPKPVGIQLLLTGGLDSRTLLALMCETGFPPDQAMSWGVTDDISESDVAVASQLAADYQIPFRFLRYDQDTFDRQAEPWAYVSELGSDNLGNFVAGPNFLYRAGPVAPVVLNGDQLFGTGGIPVGRKDAFEVASDLPFAGPVAGLKPLLKDHQREPVGEIASAGVRRLAEPRWCDPPKDLQDYLGHHLRIARWLNAPTYFREPMVSTLRPLLHQPAVDLFQTLPAGLRVDKRLLVAMLRRYLSPVLKRPLARANSLVDWDRAFTADGPTAAYFRALLLDERLRQSVLAEFMDWQAVEAALEDYMANAQAPLSRQPAMTSRIMQIRRASSRSQLGSLTIRGIQRTVNRLLGRQVGAGTQRVLKRLVLLSLLLRIMDSGWFHKGAPWVGSKKVILIAPCWPSLDAKGSA